MNKKHCGYKFECNIKLSVQ